MPFGLKTAPQTFQRVLNTVFSDYLYQWLIIYIDACNSWSASYDEALGNYKKVFERTDKFCLQFKPSKCVFFSKDLQILGQKVTTEGRYPTEKGTEAISNLPPPRNASQLRNFLGMIGYFREYIPNMTMKRKPPFHGHPNTRRNSKILKKRLILCLFILISKKF